MSSSASSTSGGGAASPTTAATAAENEHLTREQKFAMCFPAVSAVPNPNFGLHPFTLPEGALDRVDSGTGKQDTQYVNWICTIFPEKYGSREGVLIGLQHLAGQATYAVFGSELAPTTGRVHIHGVIVFDKRVRFTQLRKKYPIHIHWEPMRGNLAQAVAYATKDDKEPFIFGTPPLDAGDREKERWTRARGQLKTGDVEALDDDQIYVCHYKAASAIASKFMSLRDVEDLLTMPEVFWLYGVPGAGKSHYARAHCVKSELYLKDFSKFWCSYDPFKHTAVLIEDIGPNEAYLISRLKAWTDKYVFTVERKGLASIPIRPLKFFLTSNYAPEQIFTNDVDCEALRRRMKVLRFDHKYEEGKPIEPIEERATRFLSDAELRAVVRETKPGSVSTVNLPERRDLVVDLTGDDDTDDEDLIYASKSIPLTRSVTVAPSHENTVDLTQEEDAESADTQPSSDQQVTPIPAKSRKRYTRAPEVFSDVDEDGDTPMVKSKYRVLLGAPKKKKKEFND